MFRYQKSNMKINAKSHQVPTSADQHLMKVNPLSAAGQDSDEQDQSPPLSPIRMPQLSSSSSSIASWSSSSQSSSSDDGECNSGMSKEDRATYNTKFARYHLETYRQNDRMRWNFDFDHNRPLDDSHHHHQTTTARYQWEPAAI